MPPSSFDIYQSDKGYVAVTNPVRQKILTALAEGEKELPELMEITGKAKPTLSSVHMKDLLAQRLIEAEPHPTDSRRKVYRLIGHQIGSSSVPVEALRDAVKDYVSLSPLAARFPLTFSFRALAAAPPDVDLQVLRQQAKALGKAAGQALQFQPVDDLIMGMAPFLEQEGLARPLRLDLEHQTLELAYGPGLSEFVPPEFLGTLLAGFVEGVAHAKGIERGVVLEAFDGERRCRLRLNGSG